MDLTSFLPTIGVVVGALATLGGVAITTRSARKAEDKRLNLEADREATRIRREDEASERAAVDGRSKRQIEIYDQIAQMFVGELSTLRAQRSKKPDARFEGFADLFDPDWSVNGDTRLRRVVAGLTEDSHRLRITQILDAIVDHSAIGMIAWVEDSEFVEALLLLGFDLASTYARGQEPDGDLDTRWATFRKQVADSDAYRERQRQAQVEQWQREKEAREAAEAAEAAKEADIKSHEEFARDAWEIVSQDVEDSTPDAT